MSWGKVITILLLILTIYSGLTIFTSSHKRLTINDIEIPENKKTEYINIIKEVKESKKHKIKVAKEQDNNISKQRKHSKNDNFKVISKNNILFKLKSYKIQNDNLIINAYLYNKGSNSIKKSIYIVCVAYEDKNAVDQFSWKKEIRLNSKETTLIKDMNFGYATAGGFDTLKCIVK